MSRRKCKLTSRKITDSQTIITQKYLLAQAIKRYDSYELGGFFGDFAFNCVIMDINRENEIITERLIVGYKGAKAHADFCYHWDERNEDRGLHILRALKEIDKKLAIELGKKLRAEQRREWEEKNRLMNLIRKAPLVTVSML